MDSFGGSCFAHIVEFFQDQVLADMCVTIIEKSFNCNFYQKNRQEEGDSKVQKIGSCGSRTHFQLVMSKLLDR